MNTTHTTLKKLVVQNKSNRRILIYKSFSITYESFSTDGTGWFVYHKKPRSTYESPFAAKMLAPGAAMSGCEASKTAVR
jgi:hypothetical protein